MARNFLDQLKAKQIADAEKMGEPHPYSKEARLAKAMVIDAAAPVAASATSNLSHYQTMLKEDLSRLSGLSVEEKITLKRDLVSKYTGFVQAYIDSGERYDNPIAVHLMIWLFDLKTIEPALRIADYLMNQDCHTMPERFNSTMQTFVCDYTYDWANALLAEKQPVSPYLDDVVAVMESKQWQLSPPVRSKMYAMLAKHKELTGDYTTAIALCDKAKEANPTGHGTVKLRERLEKLARKS